MLYELPNDFTETIGFHVEECDSVNLNDDDYCKIKQTQEQKVQMNSLLQQFPLLLFITEDQMNNITYPFVPFWD
jgi:hypothetical protein